MARDKAKDDKHFNCSQEHEFTYVSGLYSDKTADKIKVYLFLKKKCEDGSIKYSTHYEVYGMIKDEIGYPIPN